MLMASVRAAVFERAGRNKLVAVIGMVTPTGHKKMTEGKSG